jgi:hypothetical protein
VRLNKRHLAQAEALAACAIFFYAALYFRAEDPFFFFSSYPVYALVLISLTLFNGIYAGLSAIIFAAGLSYFYYTPYPQGAVLWLALTGLTAGEFKIYWDRKIHRYIDERDYFKEKLRDLTKNFITLKLSHERLEKSYILRPVSIRGSLKEIRNMLLEDKKTAAQNFINFLASFYGINAGAVYMEEGADWSAIASAGAGAEYDPEDPLLKLALEKRETAFFAVSRLQAEAVSRYIAVLPYFEFGAETPEAVLLVGEIPFLHLNKDNLLTISLYFSFFMGAFRNAEHFREAAQAYPALDYSIFKETARLLKMRRDYGLVSVFAVFNPRYGEMSKEVASFIEAKVRDFDLGYNLCGEHCLVLVLLPLTDYANAEVFAERISAQVKANFHNIDGELGKSLVAVTGNSVKEALSRALPQ